MLESYTKNTHIDKSSWDICQFIFNTETMQSTQCTFPNMRLWHKTHSKCALTSKWDGEKHCQKSDEESCFIPSQMTQRNQRTKEFVANLRQHIGVCGLGMLPPVQPKVILPTVPTCLYNYRVNTPEHKNPRKNKEIISKQGAVQNT